MAEGTIAKLAIALGLNPGGVVAGAVEAKKQLKDLQTAAVATGAAIDKSMAQARDSIVGLVATLRAAKTEMDAIARDPITFTVQMTGLTEAAAQVAAFKKAASGDIPVRLSLSGASVAGTVADTAALSALTPQPGGGGGGGRSWWPFILGALWGHGGRGGNTRIGLGPLGFNLGFGLAGIGSLGSLAGLGPEHFLMTALGLGGFAAGGVLGGGLQGIGTFSPSLLGMGTNMMVSRSAMADMFQGQTSLLSLYQDLEKAVLQYGAASQQAATAQANLNLQMKILGNTAGVQAEMALVKQADALNDYWDKQTSAARVAFTRIGSQVLTIAKGYIPQIGQAAATNFGIMNQALQPLFKYLAGPAHQVFTDLMAIFQRDLPYTVDAFDNLVEIVIKTVDYLANTSVGNLAETVDNFLKRVNSPSGFAQWIHIVDYLRQDFRLWWDVIKNIGLDIYYLFKQDAGTAQSIVTWLDQALIRLGQWERTTQGAAQIHTLFEVHKQQILEILNLLPPLITTFTNLYMTVAPSLTLALTTVLGAIEPILQAVAANPFGAWLLGLGLIAGKLYGFGKLFQLMFTPLYLATQAAVQGLLGMGTAADTASGVVSTAAGEMTLTADELETAYATLLTELTADFQGIATEAELAATRVSLANEQMLPGFGAAVSGGATTGLGARGAAAGAGGLLGGLSLGGILGGLSTVLAGVIGGNMLGSGIGGALGGKTGAGAGGIAGSIGGGAAAGALVGTFIVPVIGTLAGAVIGAILGSIPVIVDHWKQVTDGIGTAFKFLSDHVGGGIKDAYQWLSDHIGGGVGTVVGAIVSTIEGTWQTLSDHVGGALATTAKAIAGGISGVWQWLSDHIGGFFGAIPGAVGNFVSSLVRFFTQDPAKIGAEIGDALHSIPGHIADGIRAAWQWLSDHVGGFLAKWPGAIASTIRGAWQTLSDHVGGFLAKVPGAIASTIQGAWQTLSDHVGGFLAKVPGAIGSGIQGVWQWLSDHVGGWLKNSPSNIGGGIQGVWQALSDHVGGFLAKVPGAIASSIQGIWQWLSDNVGGALSNVVQGIVGGIVAVWNWITSLISNLVGHLIFGSSPSNSPSSPPVVPGPRTVAGPTSSHTGVVPGFKPVAQYGGFFSAPLTGGWVMLHGREYVVPEHMTSPVMRAAIHATLSGRGRHFGMENVAPVPYFSGASAAGTNSDEFAKKVARELALVLQPHNRKISQSLENAAGSLQSIAPRPAVLPARLK